MSFERSFAATSRRPRGRARIGQKGSFLRETRRRRRALGREFDYGHGCNIKRHNRANPSSTQRKRLMRRTRIVVTGLIIGIFHEANARQILLFDGAYDTAVIESHVFLGNDGKFTVTIEVPDRTLQWTRPQTPLRWNENRAQTLRTSIVQSLNTEDTFDLLALIAKSGLAELGLSQRVRPTGKGSMR